MTTPKPFADPILRRGAIGFLAIIALCWLVELLQLPHRLFDEAPHFNWFRVLFRTAIILSIWAWVHFTTKRLLERLHRLEEFLLVCAWCRKLGYQGKWVAMEEYFGSKFDTKTSHSICPECLENQLEGPDGDCGTCNQSSSTADKSTLGTAQDTSVSSAFSEQLAEAAPLDGRPG